MIFFLIQPQVHYAAIHVIFGFDVGMSGHYHPALFIVEKKYIYLQGSEIRTQCAMLKGPGKYGPTDQLTDFVDL